MEVSRRPCSSKSNSTRLSKPLQSSSRRKRCASPKSLNSPKPKLNPNSLFLAELSHRKNYWKLPKFGSPTSILNLHQNSLQTLTKKPIQTKNTLKSPRLSKPHPVTRVQEPPKDLSDQKTKEKQSIKNQLIVQGMLERRRKSKESSGFSELRSNSTVDLLTAKTYQKVIQERVQRDNPT